MSGSGSTPPRPIEERFELLHRIGIALASEHDRNRLVESILLEAKHLCFADGGTLYLVEDDALHFAMIHSDSLGVAQGGTTGNAIALPPIALFDAQQRPNRSSVAACAAHDRSVYNIPDAYADARFEHSGFRRFDAQHQYRTVSLLAIPLTDAKGRVLAVLQLVNAYDPATKQVTPFDAELQRTVTALAAQAGLALDNQALLAGQRELLEAFIRLLAEAIDAKSPYTGAHCERVPVLTEMIAKSLCETTSGPFAGFALSDDEWRELRVAAWLHDCGKITTPVHVMDKATKLEAISDRIEAVEARYSILERDAEVAYLEQVLAGAVPAEAKARCDQQVAELREELQLLRRLNRGSETVDPSDLQRLKDISKRECRIGGEVRPLLEPDWLENLSILRGTLTEAQRLTINGHMVQTLRMLERLPFPPDLQRVPEYAACHHERMDGKGYPRGIFAVDMSIPARALAIADVFEALTASDRPYKSGKTLSESLKIMGHMKRNNHLDPLLLDHVVQSGVFQEYAARFLKPEQIDEPDVAALLNTQPLPFVLPNAEERRARFRDVLPEYRTRE